MSKILITGASGFLGTKLSEMYAPKTEILGTYFGHSREGLVSLDVTNSSQTHDLITRFRPDIVIHTVALSDPDVCEQRKEGAERINYLGTKNIVEACRKTGARLDYISTVYVFDGEKGHYTEEDTPHPINWYGETKLRAEQEVMTLPSWGIYRFDKLYGYNGLGKPNDLLSKIMADKPFEVNNDQIRQPLLVDDIGRALQRMQELGMNSILHLAGPDKISKFELTLRLARLLGKESLVVPIPEKQQIARRPKDASIETNKAESLGITFTSLERAIPMIEGVLRKEDREGQQRKEIGR
jgi:dTDP-4-dehydrorhamnose reductase